LEFGLDDRFWPKPDMPWSFGDVCFGGKADMAVYEYTP